MHLKAALFFGGFFVAFVAFMVITMSRIPEEMERSKHLNDSIKKTFNYSFAGIVKDYEEHIVSRGLHIGVVTLDVKYADITQFDPRDSSDIYFCILKHKTLCRF